MRNSRMGKWMDMSIKIGRGYSSDGYLAINVRNSPVEPKEIALTKEGKTWEANNPSLYCSRVAAMSSAIIREAPRAERCDVRGDYAK